MFEWQHWCPDVVPVGETMIPLDLQSWTVPYLCLIGSFFLSCLALTFLLSADGQSTLLNWPRSASFSNNPHTGFACTYTSNSPALITYQAVPVIDSSVANRTFLALLMLFKLRNWRGRNFFKKRVIFGFSWFVVFNNGHLRCALSADEPLFWPIKASVNSGLDPATMAPREPVNHYIHVNRRHPVFNSPV